MRKTGTITQTVAEKASPARGHWLRNADPDPLKSTGRSTTTRTKKAHFLEPYRLSKAQRASLLELLASHSVGDRESRELFAAAVEYGIASCRASLPEPPGEPDRAPPVAKREGLLGALAESARLLAERLNGLEELEREAILSRLQSSDPFERAHDTTYLAAVSREARRIAEAAVAALEAGAPAPVRRAGTSRAAGPSSDTARRLILRVADAYEDCFEAQARTEPDSAFVPVLRLLAEEAGIEIPSNPASLQAVLQRA
ncbi:MAG: hypothetical protein LJE60_14030 [Thiocapsa sp.]|nr:hypothetical protein [Thiocapsa sp.]MCG6898204.1 hypothetical protein [Thiocapsa sp.]